ncbi:MAG: segregation and condensation protein A [Candidatus Xenobium sp.]|nr:segregation/condensation protein A [Burkholderiales bacterium]
MKPLRAPASTWQVYLDQFEGPLDLLLHLVRDAQLDITEIALAAVAQQYFSYLETMHRLDVEIESSYLVVFAQLLELKSRLLLPEDPGGDEQLDLDFGEEESDAAPRESDPLVDRLAAYALVKEAADWLASREATSFARYPRPSGLPFPDEPELEVSVEALAAAMRRLESSPRAPRDPVAVEKMVLSVPERIRELWSLFIRQPLTCFRDLLGARPTRSLVVVTFLALLELARRRKVTLRQQTTVGDIEVKRLEEP